MHKATLREAFYTTFGREASALFSSPGRTELIGNHTDHQNGLVLCAAVDRAMWAAVAENGTDRVRIHSEGFPETVISLTEMTPQETERETSAALVRGVLSAFPDARGFDAYITSAVPPGSGLSSSAAFEVLIGTVASHLFAGGSVSPDRLAAIGQEAENRYYGKPCGRMDQMACAYGGVIEIDFRCPTAPSVRRVPLALEASGYALVILDCGADHADLTEEYASIPADLSRVCAYFGKRVLREVPETDLRASLPSLREAVGERAVLRAMHVFAENGRVRRAGDALDAGRFEAFLREVRASGRSSAALLGNIIPERHPERRALAFTIAYAEALLGGRGAVRVHGGGFAGTAQAYVPLSQLDIFTAEMERVLGAGHCHTLTLCPHGSRRED